jgi:hypothetical protein
MHMVRTGRARLLAALGLLMALLVPQRAEAVVITSLLDLLSPGASLTIGDKVFDQFTFESIVFGGASPVNPALVSLIGSEVDPFRVRIDFESGEFVSGAAQDQMTILTFRVRTTRDLITDNHLELLAAAVGNGVILITEQVTDAAGRPLGGALVYLSASSIPTDDNEFAPQTEVFVRTDIRLIGNASLTAFRQDFTEVAVPEPSSLVLMGLGSLVLGGRAWRRKRAGMNAGTRLWLSRGDDGDGEARRRTWLRGCIHYVDLFGSDHGGRGHRTGL